MSHHEPSSDRVIAACLTLLRQAQPTWTAEACATALGLGEHEHLQMLLRTAGFPSHRADPPDVRQVLTLRDQGVWSDTVIAEESHIPIERVREILVSYAGYGQAAYGITSYGGDRTVSDGRTAVPRHVTVVGQLSYRGASYTLGRLYRGRIAWLIERRPRLTVSFGDRPALELAMRRHGRTKQTIQHA